jgi:hypothetical protein
MNHFLLSFFSEKDVPPKHQSLDSLQDIHEVIPEELLIHPHRRCGREAAVWPDAADPVLPLHRNHFNLKILFHRVIAGQQMINGIQSCRVIIALAALPAHLGRDVFNDK